MIVESLILRIGSVLLPEHSTQYANTYWVVGELHNPHGRGVYVVVYPVQELRPDSPQITDEPVSIWPEQIRLDTEPLEAHHCFRLIVPGLLDGGIADREHDAELYAYVNARAAQRHLA